MADADLRAFIARLESLGELKRVAAPVSPPASSPAFVSSFSPPRSLFCFAASSE